MNGNIKDRLLADGPVVLLGAKQAMHDNNGRRLLICHRLRWLVMVICQWDCSERGSCLGVKSGQDRSRPRDRDTGPAYAPGDCLPEGRDSCCNANHFPSTRQMSVVSKRTPNSRAPSLDSGRKRARVSKSNDCEKRDLRSRNRSRRKAMQNSER